MTIRPALISGSNCGRVEAAAADASAVLKAMAAGPLHELGPGASGAEAATLGLGLGLAAQWVGPAGLVWAGEEGAFTEAGAPYPPGLVQFGLDLSQLIVVRGKKREDALWAAEQALGVAGAVVVCALGAHRKPLELKATRRLLLIGERNRARCLLLRPLDEASAAWTRWRVFPQPSAGEGRELGRPAFRAELVRNRAGPAGQIFTLEWSAHERRLINANRLTLAGAVSAAPVDGSADPRRARA